MHDYVTKAEQRAARNLAHEMFMELHGILEGEYTFYTKLVGSGKKGTVIRDSDGRFDLDYQIILTKNSKIFKETGKFDPTETKRKFMGEMQKILKSHRLEDSTTAITLNDKTSKFSIDFVLIDSTNDNRWDIIKRNNKGSVNEYTWNIMPSQKGYSDYYERLPENERFELANKIRDLKIKDKSLSEGKRKGSYVLTMQEIKEHMDEHGHKG